MRPHAFVLALAATLASPAFAQAESLAILPVKLLDTSHEARDQAQDHERRLELLAKVLASGMAGQRIERTEVERACSPQTTDCLVKLLRDRGAERGLFVVVQKTSTLILQIFADLVDIRNEKLLVHKELNFRGDNDEAWRRAGEFLARQLEAAPDGASSRVR